MAAGTVVMGAEPQFSRSRLAPILSPYFSAGKTTRTRIKTQKSTLNCNPPLIALERSLPIKDGLPPLTALHQQTDWQGGSVLPLWEYTPDTIQQARSRHVDELLTDPLQAPNLLASSEAATHPTADTSEAP